MMNELLNLWDAYLAWRMAPVEVYMGIPPLVAAALIGTGGTLLSGFLNRPSGAEEPTYGGRRPERTEQVPLAERRALFSSGGPFGFDLFE